MTGGKKINMIEVNNLKSWIENWFDKNKYYHPHSKSENIPKSELYDILEQIENVESIPIEWIKKYNSVRGWEVTVTTQNAIDNMLNAWEKENGRD